MAYTVPFNDLYGQYRSIKEDVDAAIRDVIESSAFVRGPFVEAFEESFKTAVGARHCISCGNGTDALYIALRALGLAPGDEVITTALSWISTSETITQAGGDVVFCDVTPSTLTIDVDLLEQRITPRTKGIVPVHLYGHPVDMPRLMEIARAHGLWVVEDCAQAHLASVQDRQVGTFGDVATFSFYPGKNLGAMGDGGCIVTNSDELATWAARFARHGGLVKNEHHFEGVNSRLDGIQAAVLSVKLRHLQRWTEARRAIAALYRARLARTSRVQPLDVANGCDPVYHLFVVTADDRDGLRRGLEHRGIQTVVNYPRALPFLPAYQRLGATYDDFPVAAWAQDRVLSLPIYPELEAWAVEFVCQSIESHYAAGAS